MGRVWSDENGATVRNPLWPFQADPRFRAQSVPVVTRVYSKWTHYLDYRSSSYNEPEQMSVLRSSFRHLDGQAMLLGRYDFDEAEVWYAGTWSRVQSAHERAAVEFTTGAVFGLPGTSTQPKPDPGTFALAEDFVGGVVMTTISGYNIHHFVYEHLTSAWIHRTAFGQHSPVLIGASDLSSLAFQGPLLRLLGLNIDPVLLPLNSRVRIRECTMLATFPFRVYAMPVLQEIRRRISQAACREQEHIGLDAVEGHGAEVVYLGRGDNERNRRPLVNEESVLEVLRDRWPDLLVVRSAQQPVEQTIRDVRSARIIIGPTAGALVHHLWAVSLEHVIELVPDEYPGVTETFEVSDLFDFQHHAVPTSTQRTSPRDRWADAGQLADITELRRVVDTLNGG